MRYLTKLHHTEINQLQLIMLCDDDIERADVVINQLLILRQFLNHVNSLQEDVEQLFVPMKELLPLAGLSRVIGAHGAGRALIILINKVFQCQLCVEHTTVLPFFDSDIVEYL